jgi:hypothetical protein
METLLAPAIDEPTKTDELSPERKQELGEAELNVIAKFTLADAIRNGCEGTKQSVGWGDGEATGCALTTAVIGAKRAGYL